MQGKQRDYVTCRECGRTSHTEDVFQDLKLVVPLETASGASTSTADAGHATHPPAGGTAMPGSAAQPPGVKSALCQLFSELQVS